GASVPADCSPGPVRQKERSRQPESTKKSAFAWTGSNGRQVVTGVMARRRPAIRVADHKSDESAVATVPAVSSGCIIGCCRLQLRLSQVVGPSRMKHCN